jgi:hypothetical protein
MERQMSLSKHIVCEPRSFKLAFQNDATVNIKEINDEILDSVSKYSIKAVLGYTKKGRAVTFEELARNGITEDLEGTDEEILKVLTFDFKEEKIFVLDKQAPVPLSRLKLTVSYRYWDEPVGDSPSDAGPLDPEDEDYTADVFVRTNEA